MINSKYVSSDPYLRGSINDPDSYVVPFEVSKPFVCGIIAEVIQSKISKLTRKIFSLGRFSGEKHKSLKQVD